MISGLPPARLSSLIGRTAELERLRELTRDCRLVTITGASGSGKTRLAAEVSAAVDSTFVDLSQSHDAEEVAAALLSALDLIPASVAAARRQAAQHLRDSRLLLVLDNCEQVVDAVAELALDLLATCPDLRLLATSQEPLAVQGEMELRLGALSAADAERLFSERIREGDPTFSPAGADLALVSLICRRLDCLPLALELAAAQARTMPLADVHAGLDRRFDLLQAGLRGIPERHRSLAAAIAWSHSLLSPAEQTLFRRLALIPGSFDRSGVVATAYGRGLSAADVERGLPRLVQCSLVDFDRSGGAYRMAESLRAFGRDRLAEAGELAETALAAARWADGRAAHAKALELTGVALQALPPDHAELPDLLDLRAKQAERAAHYAAGVDALERLRALPVVASDPARLAGVEMRLASAISMASGDLDFARTTAERALAILRAQGDQVAALQVENEIAWLRGLGGDLAGQREEALRIVAEAAGLEAGATAHLHALGSAGCACLFMGRFSESRSLLEAGLALARDAHDTYQTGWFGGILTSLLALSEGPAAARRLLDEVRQEVGENIDPVLVEGLVFCNFLAGTFSTLLADLENLSAQLDMFGYRACFILAAGSAAAVEAGDMVAAERLRDRAQLQFDAATTFYFQGHTGGWLLSRLDEARGDVGGASRATLDTGRYIARLGVPPIAALALVDALPASEEELAAILEGLSGRLFEGLKAFGTRGGSEALARAGYRCFEGRSLEAEGRLDDALAVYTALGMKWRRDRLLARRARSGQAPNSPAAIRLAGLVLFEGVPANELEELVEAGLQLELPPGATVFAPGDAADALYVVDAGRVRLGAGAEVGPGETFGERSLLAGEVQILKASSAQASSLLRIPAAAVLEFAESRPEVMDRLLTVVRQRLRQEATLTGQPEPADVSGRLLGAVQDRLIAKGAAPPAYEVLPVYPLAGATWRLRPRDADSWLVDATPGRSPEKVVQAALDAAGLAAEIVHSTSWRYQDGRLVLTYLAVAARPIGADGFEALLSERAELARGSARGAPASIDIGQVVEHGLRHLSWLSRDDKVIAEELTPEWLAIVSGYVPEPFRAL